VSGYSDSELQSWAQKIITWRDTPRKTRDVYVYFDNDAKVHAPFDALNLAKLVAAR
jgi:uncharacterized protein YecE (DUF72 family)